MHNYKQLKIWKKSIDFAESVYRITESYPNNEKYGLISQLQRAVVSISSNIAEGSAKSNPDFARFLSIAIGSSFEIESQLILSQRLGYILLQQQITELQKMIFSFKQNL